MNLTRATVLATLLASGLGAASAANASATADLCAAELDAVRTAITSATFTGKNAAADLANLLGKLDSAEDKVLDGKVLDAATKLQDLADTATVLATAPKPKLQDASNINASVANAVACLAQ